MSRLVAVSEDVKWVVALREGVDPQRIDVVPNGVDSLRFRPPQSAEELARREMIRASLGVEPGEVLISSVGSMLPRKGHGTLVQALSGLVRRELRVKLIAVGAGEGGPGLKALGERLGVSGALIIEGQRPDIPELLRASDIFALLSHTEGFSNAVIEGMASGLPVVVTDVGGMREAVSEEAGFIVPVNDALRTEVALEALVRDEGLRRSMGATGRRVAIEEHAFDRMLHRYLDIHERVLCESRR